MRLRTRIWLNLPWLFWYISTIVWVYCVELYSQPLYFLGAAVCLIITVWMFLWAGKQVKNASRDRE